MANFDREDNSRSRFSSSNLRKRTYDYAYSKYNSITYDVARWAEKKIATKLKSKFTLSINISNSTSLYYRRLIDFVKTTVRKSYKYIERNGDRDTLISSILINTHNKCFIYIDITQTDIVDVDNGDYVSGAKIYIFGPNARKIYKKVDAFLKFNPNNVHTNGMIKTYNIMSEKDREWTSYRNDIEMRRFDTIFLDGNLEQEIRDFIKGWEAKEELFASRGLTHKTGLLIHGKAGTGKTTIAKIIASEFGYTLINIDSTKFEYINIPELVEAINNEPGKHIVFIDEIDSIFKSRDNEDTTDDQTKRTNMLLTFLDGINSPNHTVFVATTNYYNRLDKAVTRKGRFDKVIELSDLNKETAVRMCKSFGLADEDIEKILSHSKYKKPNKNGYSVNPAELQADIVEVLKAQSMD